MDIASWLRMIGLEQYEGVFRENDIDAEVLPELNVDDLIAIGIVSVGHRRKMLAAISALRLGKSARGATPPATTRVPSATHPSPEGGRTPSGAKSP